MPIEIAFASSYHDARARFMQALSVFEETAGRAFSRERCAIDASEDLTIDIAELVPKEPRRLYMAISGAHGIEGYAGNAIQRALLSDLLLKLDLDHTGVVLVHALNPVGMHRMRRVNGNNVDLNRNFSAKGDALYSTDSSGFRKLASLLQPQGPYHRGLASHLKFLASVSGTLLRGNLAVLREAALGGQYIAPQAVFYGGAAPEPETLFLQRYFEALCERYPEILLTDLHTGYGNRANAHLLFGRCDSADLQDLSSEGVRDKRGRDQAYVVHGDIVGYCWETAKRRRPDGTFNGTVVELGTHGLGRIEQADDLHTVVRENQIRHYGARDTHTETTVLHDFRELFYPGDPLWQRQALTAALGRINELLKRRAFL